MTKQEIALRAIMAAWNEHAPEGAEMPAEIQLCHIALEEISRTNDPKAPVGFWQGKFSDDGGATLYEVPQESVFGKTYPNYPLYAEGHRNIKRLTVDQWHKHWQVASVMDNTEAEFDFADFILIAQDVEAVYGIRDE